MRVLLISMPFGALDRPALGVSLLKARLSKYGIACDIQYLNVRFAELTGIEEYRWVSSELPYTAFAGDWTFTASLYGEKTECDRSYIDEILKKTWRLDDYSIYRLLRIRRLVGYFLDYCMQGVAWDSYGIVGFTSTFEQNIASLALAKRIKEKYPGVAIVFGGANWEGDMGLELHRAFSFVDYVCSGEADESFPELVSRLSEHRAIDES
ncbi:MAG: RiPP maturation radical SAM C-methyltransferase, partial [Gammaproteobacteria bacterium]